jgi:hypothetical protein
MRAVASLFVWVTKFSLVFMNSSWLLWERLYHLLNVVNPLYWMNLCLNSYCLECLIQYMIFWFEGFWVSFSVNSLLVFMSLMNFLFNHQFWKSFSSFCSDSYWIQNLCFNSWAYWYFSNWVETLKSNESASLSDFNCLFPTHSTLC